MLNQQIQIVTNKTVNYNKIYLKYLCWTHAHYTLL